MSIDYDNVINIINQNKEYINDSIIFVPYTEGKNSQINSDFFENIVSVLTNTVIFAKDRISESHFIQPIPQDLISKSVCILFIESYNKYSIKDFSEWFEDFYKNTNFNFESYKILDSDNFKLEIKNPKYDSDKKESLMTSKTKIPLNIEESESLVQLNNYKDKFLDILQKDWPQLFESEKFFYNLNKVF